MRLTVELTKMLDTTLEAIDRVMRLHEPVLCNLPSRHVRSEADRERMAHFHCKTCGPAQSYPCTTITALVGPQPMTIDEPTVENRVVELEVKRAAA